MGMIIYVILSCCFCWIWLWNWLVFELSVCDGLKLLCFRYLWTRVVIAMWTPMYKILVNYLWNVCNMWLVMLNQYDLGCMQVGLKSFMVSVDYRVYMGSSMMVWSLRWLLLYLCSYKLVGSITLGPLSSESFKRSTGARALAPMKALHGFNSTCSNRVW